MKPGSRHSIHRGINFVITPPPVINPESALQFQHALIRRGIEFATCERSDGPEELRLVVGRATPAPLQVGVVANKKQPIGQIVVLASPPERSLEVFVQEAEAVVVAYEDTWPGVIQLIHCDVALRDLYETTSQHAFQELWEGRLGQGSASLAALGGPVLGGGLRFVMPPHGAQKAQIEVKIESFLQDSTKVFVETQFGWNEAAPPGHPLEPRECLETVDSYARQTVVAFIQGEVAGV